MAKVDATAQLALLSAAAAGDIGGIRAALEQGAQVDLPGPNGQDALSRAVSGHHSEAVAYMVSLVDTRSPMIGGARMKMLLSICIASKDVATLEVLLEIRPRVTEPVIRAGAMILLATNGRRGSIERILAPLTEEQRWSTVCASYEQMTPLIAATRSGDLETVRLLLDSHALPSSSNEYGDTALHVAESPEIAELLISRGAFPGAVGHRRRLPLHAAARHPAVLKVLLRHEPPLHAKDHLGHTPLVEAVIADQSESVSMLLEAGARPDDLSLSGATALFHARSAEVVGLLVAAGARLDAQDREGLTPLHVAVQQRTTQVIAALLAARATVDLQDRQGRTSLFCACMLPGGDLERIRLLLEAGADPDAKARNAVMNTPLLQAERYANREIPALLNRYRRPTSQRGLIGAVKKFFGGGG